MSVILLIFTLSVSGYLIIMGCVGLFTKKYQILCDYETLCKNIVSWGIDNLPPFNESNKLSVVIKDKNKNKMANYFPYSRKIEIYMNSHYNVYEIVDTLLHEITHYKQHQSKPRTILKDYKKLLDVHGYENHPMEIEANKNAKKYTNSCIEYLERNSFIV